MFICNGKVKILNNKTDYNISLLTIITTHTDHGDFIERRYSQASIQFVHHSAVTAHINCKRKKEIQTRKPVKISKKNSLKQII